jgi:hypothetical protein
LKETTENVEMKGAPEEIAPKVANGIPLATNGHIKGE